MNLYDVKSVEELDEFGSLDEIINLVSSEIGEGISISATSLDEMLGIIQRLNIVFGMRDAAGSDGYFKSTLDKLIFSLTELDGKNRQKQLDIGPLHYKNRELAKKWKKTTASKLHEDRCDHPKAKEAWHKMEEIYKEMIGK
jgi:hypothetical protein